MTGDWIETPLPLSAIPNRDRFAQRRQALSRAFPGATLIVPAGEERVRANDTHFRYRPSSDFAYLAGGPAEPRSVLVLESGGAGYRSLLFVPAHNRGEAASYNDRVAGELWVGRHRGVPESQIFFGVDETRPQSELDDYLESLSAAGREVAAVRGLDRRVDGKFDRTERDSDLQRHLAEMRLFKDRSEIEELRRCVEITKRGFEDVIRVLPRAASEREIEAAFWRRARIEANDVGYLTIAASGEHACTLHWTKNGGTLRKEDLLLLDAGVEAESLYTADITRTLPISGRFSTEQRAGYEIVHEAQRAAFGKVRPGNDFLEPNRAAMLVLTEGLRDLGILRCSVEEALDEENQFYRRYTLHNVSHMLGLDVHDCATARAEKYRHGKLQQGMALTVEPGLYFQIDDASVPDRFRGIGVRIEDDVVVTADGHENLSAIIPSAADAVETWMAELQKS